MKIHISPFTYLLYALMLILYHDRAIVASITAVVLHEAAHLIAIALSGCSIERIDLTPIGLTIRRSGLTGHLQDLAIDLAGPLANLALATAWSVAFDAEALPVAANLFFGLLNLLPIESLDGSKAVEALLSIGLTEWNCRRICRILSNAALFLLWLIAAAELLMLDGSPSLLVFCIGLFMTRSGR